MPFYQRHVPPEVAEKTWSRLLDLVEPMYALVAEVDGKVLGFATYLFHRHTALINEICYLQDLFTDETARGRGIGKSLIFAVYEQAEERGSLQVYCMTHNENEIAKALYDQIAKYTGFVVYSQRV